MSLGPPATGGGGSWVEPGGIHSPPACHPGPPGGCSLVGRGHGCGWGEDTRTISFCTAAALGPRARQGLPAGVARAQGCTGFWPQRSRPGAYLPPPHGFPLGRGPRLARPHCGQVHLKWQLRGPEMGFPAGGEPAQGRPVLGRGRVPHSPLRPVAWDRGGRASAPPSLPCRPPPSRLAQGL